MSLHNLFSSKGSVLAAADEDELLPVPPNLLFLFILLPD
jgi:hypothetical protein